MVKKRVFKGWSTLFPMTIKSHHFILLILNSCALLYSSDSPVKKRRGDDKDDAMDFQGSDGFSIE